MFAWLESKHAAEMRGDSDRAGQVGADIKRRHPTRHRCRRAATRSARRTGRVPRIVGATEHRVVCLKVGTKLRDVCLTSEHSARTLEPGGDGAVVARNVIEWGKPDGGSHARS